ncbi:hypothetical protein [Macellibacteroides fermentans]|uniref:Uncharacterized protein n=1 Tax=Parabacteroides chartae TaxID=1037355 RepID=A0A1T5AYQ9_9BACT|nr:hypothetical protein [Parabacteroides chartae]SKB39927.1 hypothetical protein SAMN05660349_00911 [Parabacteroides chartae]
MTLVNINEMLLKTLQIGREIVKSLCRKNLPYFGQLKRVIKGLKEGSQKEVILQSLLGWAMGEIEGEILHWKELAASFLKEYHKVKNTENKVQSKDKTVKQTLPINMTKRELILLFFRQMYDVGAFLNCTIEKLARFINDTFHLDKSYRTISNSLSKFKVEKEKDLVYHATLILEQKKQE